MGSPFSGFRFVSSESTPIQSEVVISITTFSELAVCGRTLISGYNVVSVSVFNISSPYLESGALYHSNAELIFARYIFTIRTPFPLLLLG